MILLSLSLYTVLIVIWKTSQSHKRLLLSLCQHTTSPNNICVVWLCSRSVSESLRQHALKGQLISLASCQRNLVVILQKQMYLVEVYRTMKAKHSTHTPIYEGSPVVRKQQHHFSTPASRAASSIGRGAHMCFPNSCNQDSQRKPITQASLLRSAPQSDAKDYTVPRPRAPSPTKRTKAPPHTDVLNKKVNSCQRIAPQSGNTLQHINFQMKGNNALIQTRAKDNSRHLSKLIQNGKMPSGSVLQLLLKVKKRPHKTFLNSCLHLVLLSPNPLNSLQPQNNETGFPYNLCMWLSWI